MKKTLLALVALIGLVALTGGGCDKIDNEIDCAKICSRYKDCYDSSYDTDKCTTDCHDTSNDNDSYRKKANDCEACMDDKSCASATFNCGNLCSGIVP